MPLYNSILFDAVGMRLKLAKTAVNRITNKAAPNCFPNLVFPAYTAKITIRHNTAKT